MFDDNWTYQPSSNNDSSSSSSWITIKNQGRDYYHNSNYKQALICFQQALTRLEQEYQQHQQHNQEDQRNNNNNNNHNHNSYNEFYNKESQILLSNSLACRLKIGDREMLIVAIEEAKKVRILVEYNIHIIIGTEINISFSFNVFIIKILKKVY